MSLDLISLRVSQWKMLKTLALNKTTILKNKTCEKKENGRFPTEIVAHFSDSIYTTQFFVLQSVTVLHFIKVFLYIILFMIWILYFTVYMGVLLNNMGHTSLPAKSSWHAFFPHCFQNAKIWLKISSTRMFVKQVITKANPPDNILYLTQKKAHTHHKDQSVQEEEHNWLSQTACWQTLFYHFLFFKVQCCFHLSFVMQLKNKHKYFNWKEQPSTQKEEIRKS